MGQLKTEGRAPRIIALENVLGAVTSNDGLDFAAMVAAIADLGYRVGAMVIDAVCFVPQSRPRLFVVAVDDSICIPEDCVDTMLSGGWHPPTLIRAYGQIARTLQHQWVWWNLPAADPRRTNLGDLIEDFPNGVKWNTEQETGGLLQMMSPTNRQKVLQAQFGGRVKVGTVYKRTRHGVQQAEVRFDGVAGCLRTPGGGSSRQTILMVDGPQIRSRLLSPREAARLMGLSDSYALPERYNDAYRLAGDGVVVPVVAYLTENLFNRLTQQRTGSERGRRTQAA